jgi:hypothetical protein
MVFSFSVGEKLVNPLHLGVIAARAATQALLNAVTHARTMGGIPSFGDLAVSRK